MPDPDCCGSASFCMAPRLSVVNSYCIDLTLVDKVSKVFCNSLLFAIYTKQQLRTVTAKKANGKRLHVPFIGTTHFYVIKSRDSSKWLSYACNYANYMLIWN